MTSSGLFRIPLPAEAFYNLLRNCHAAVVQYDGRQGIDGADLRRSHAAIAKALTAERPRQGLLLMGNPGNGKTTTMRALQWAINWLDDHKYFDDLKKDGFKPRFAIKTAREVSEIDPGSEEYKDLASRFVLCIDDLGMDRDRMKYGNINTTVQDLLLHRYHRRLVTFATTNLDADELKEKYEERILDRFREIFAFIPFGGTSFRYYNPDGTLPECYADKAIEI